MEWERLTGVTGAGGPGSGYVVAPRLVLTSAHVVGERGAVAVVFRPGRPGRFVGRVVWSGVPGGRDDAALVEIDDPDWMPVDGAARWGISVTHQPGLRCECWGVPDVMQRAGQPVDTAQLTGALNPGDGMVSDRYLIHLDGHPPATGADGRSPWGGMSGAAVYCGDLVVGVIAVDPVPFGHSVLEVVPGYVLHHDAEFRAVLAAHAPGTVIEAVELAGLASPEHVLHSRGAVVSPAELLTARRAAVGFRGRGELLDRLRVWAERPGVGMWLMHGPGGQGKTRLAHNFGEQFTARGGIVLWLDRTASAEDLAVAADTVVPLLVVVDYAESRPGQVAALLTVLATRHRPQPVKVLALARTAGDWWEQLADTDDTVATLLDTATVTALPVLDATDTARRDGYRAAVAGFAAHLAHLPGHAEANWPARAAALVDRPLPATMAVWTVLAVQMTALADLLDTTLKPNGSDGDRPEATASGSGAGRVGSPEGRVLVHERRYWKAAAVTAGVSPALGFGTLTDAVAATVLLPPPTPAGVNDWFARIPGLADQPVDRRDQVRAWLAGLYPAAGPYAFGQLEPDRLGEHLIGTLIADQRRTSIVETLAALVDGEDATRWVSVCARAAAHSEVDDHVGEVLTRLCVDNPTTVAVAALRVAPGLEAPGPLVRALDRLVRDPAIPTASLARVAYAMPQSSQLWADTAATLSAVLVARYRQEPDDDPTGNAPDLASSLNDRAERLAALGQREDALAASTEAVQTYQHLAEARPDTYLRELAASLNNHSNHLAAVGRREDALAASAEAVQTYQHLIGTRPDRDAVLLFPDLAGSLNNLGNRLAAVGRREEALGARRDAVRTYRMLTEVFPDVDFFPPKLASSLDMLAVELHTAGRPEEALAASTEAVQIYRHLAEAHPDTYLADFAGNLNNLANHLAAVSRPEDALAASTEANQIYRHLAEARPDAFLPGLATSLNNLSSQLTAVGLPEDALVAITEAVAIHRRLVQARPDALLPDLAMSLNNLALRLAAVGRREDVLVAITEAVTIRRRLVQAHPEAFRADLATSLTNLANGLAKLDRWEDAVTVGTEAVQIYRHLANARPDAFLAGLAGSLSSLAAQLAAVDRREDALAASTEAVQICRHLANARPDAVLADLAGSLTNFAVQLAMVGRPEDALVASTEAVQAYRRLDEARPDVFLPGLGTALNNLAVHLAAVGRRDNARVVITEAIAVRRKLVQIDPTVYQTELAQSLAVLSSIVRAGRDE